MSGSESTVYCRRPARAGLPPRWWRCGIRERKPDAAVELSPEAAAALDLVRRLRAAGWTTGGAKVLPRTVGPKVLPRRLPTR